MRTVRFRPQVGQLEEWVLLSPILQPIPTQFLQKGSTLAVQTKAADPGHVIQYQLVNTQTSFSTFDPPPPGATVNPSTGLILWTPLNQTNHYSFTVQATDDTGSSVQSFSVYVFDNPPNIQTGVNVTIPVGVFERTGSFVDRDQDQWIGVVNYGDGSASQPLVLNPDQTFRLNHLYSSVGSYTVSVTIRDSQGGQGRAFFAVTVTAPVVVSPGTPGQGSGVTSVPVALPRSFTPTTTRIVIIHGHKFRIPRIIKHSRLPIIKYRP